MERLERALGGHTLHDGSPSPLLADVDGAIGEMTAFLIDVLEGRRIPRFPGGMTAEQARAMMIDAVGDGYRRPPNVGASSGVDWDVVRSAMNERVPARVSIIVPTFQDWSMTIDAVRAALAGAADADLEVLVIENGSRPAVFRMLVAVFLGEPRVRVIRADTNTNFSGGMNIGIAASSGEFILLLNNDAMLDAGWLPPLLRPLESPDVLGVQPLLMYPGIGRVQAAGTMFLGEGVIPWHFLAGHPIEDALRPQERRFHAITAAVMMLRATDLVAAEGFDEGYRNGYEDIDLCLRMIKTLDHHFTVAVDALAYHPEGSSEGRSAHDSANRVRFLDKWRGKMPAAEYARYTTLGLTLASLRPHWFSQDVPVMLSDPHLVRPPRRVLEGEAAGVASLRWTLCLTLGADAGLVSALREDLAHLGQEVVSFSGGVRFSDGLDDVLVAFDPEAPLTPRSATFNVLVRADTDAYPDERDSGRWDSVLTAQEYDPSAGPDARRTVLAKLVNEAAAASVSRFGSRACVVTP
jgi:GT2 family glycosyltransferase